jgi:hypothetical protein
VDEGRKRVLLIAVAILAARRLASLQRDSRKHIVNGAISDGIRFANQIMCEIDRLWQLSGCAILLATP